MQSVDLTQMQIRSRQNGQILLLTWDGHDGDGQEGGRAGDHVEDGEAYVGVGGRGEEEAEQVHERHHSPAVQQQDQQHVEQVAVGCEGLDSECLEHHLGAKWKREKQDASVSRRDGSIWDFFLNFNGKSIFKE